MKEPVVFLDIDGVMTNDASAEATRSSTVFAPECVRALNRLLAASGAKIVVSSVWRLGASLEWLQTTLAKQGVVGEVIGKTCVLWGQKRGAEIQEWLDVSGSRPFVIVDDDRDMLHLLPKLVHVDNVLGLTEANVDEAIRILNEEISG